MHSIMDFSNRTQHPCRTCGKYLPYNNYTWICATDPTKKLGEHRRILGWYVFCSDRCKSVFEIAPIGCEEYSYYNV